MDMGGDGSGHACKISMLFNWYVEDACFLSRDWHIRSKTAFAFTFIGIFLMAFLVEGVRRSMREFDRYIVRKKKNATAAIVKDSSSVTSLNKRDSNLPSVIKFEPTLFEHSIRAFLFTAQFTVAFLLMLLGMYFNVIILFAIFFGAGFGYLTFARDTLTGQVEVQEVGASCC
ncbi:Ctr copper transporter [Atractiella rhizophila]|nr:Ctr copper transporter [Atractiella rhizophila]